MMCRGFMRTMLISMTESTSWPSFDVPTSNIGAHGRTPYLMLPSLHCLSYIQGFHNELWGLYGNETSQRDRKYVV
ncbi:predicted protein [Lichtheimia corymbifera JMRC:FSU:9682]|uniref:Uncharacterized protein n=1 Tax=Lichtheimia corymbifera JMRC:FSU:9682 TaxID=1263082 RepID=A0A068RS46_9FUNG|nr:predicted protein [Lichtheimia corymbifera JMRC:FSU:9682]